MEALACGTIAVCALLHAVMACVELTSFRRPFVFKRMGYTQAEADLLAPVVAHVGMHNFFLALGLAFASVPQPVFGPYWRVFVLLWTIVAATQAMVALKKLVPQVLQIGLALAGLAFAWLAGSIPLP